ncbi:hypothetical protein FRC07_001655 [Ceratobasidium sp. 392]|nr:hypothetical protein FRC07_001655 [Ceratobasidium sp. 392]
MPYVPGPHAVHVETETAITLCLSAETGARTPGTIPVDAYEENCQVHRVPRVSLVFGHQSSFSITARSDIAGERLNNPYQIFCRVPDAGGPQLKFNMAVNVLTGGHSRYPWYGDILILKFLGSREKRYVLAGTSDGTWDNDIANINHFFVNTPIPSQEGN